jgi:hypothetical protein
LLPSSWNSSVALRNYQKRQTKASLRIANMVSFRSLLALSGLTVAAVNAVPTVSVKGAKFFADGQQFFIKGIINYP